MAQAKRHDASAWRSQLYEEIGRVVMKKRIEAKLTTREVAFKLGCSYQVVSRVESGDGAPSHFLAAFAQLVQCSPGDLIPHVPCVFARTIEPEEKP